MKFKYSYILLLVFLSVLAHAETSSQAQAEPLSDAAYESLFDAVFENPSDLQLNFQRHFNQTPFEYIEEQRLLKAKELIEKHKRSKKISSIAQDVGFFHLGRFSVNFRQRFGISPSLLAED